MARYVIVGAGAVGASLAAQLVESGASALLVAREKQVALLREQGIRYQRLDGEVVVRPDVTTLAEVGELRRDDILVFTPKTQDLDTALTEWAWHPVEGGGVASDLAVVVTENGLRSGEFALRRFRTALVASLNISASYVEPGVVEVRSGPTVGVATIGVYPSGTSQLAEHIASDWREAGYAVQVVDDIARWQAAKLLFNVNNAVDVLHGSTEEVARLKADLIAEAKATFAVAGIDPADPPSERNVDVSGFIVKPRTEHGASGMSTWQSFARTDARGHEVDFLNGEVVLLGRLHGLPTPLNESVQRVLGASFRSREAPGARGISEVYEIAEALV